MNGTIYDNHALIHDTLYTKNCIALQDCNIFSILHTQFRNIYHLMVLTYHEQLKHYLLQVLYNIFTMIHVNHIILNYDQ